MVNCKVSIDMILENWLDRGSIPDQDNIKINIAK